MTEPLPPSLWAKTAPPAPPTLALAGEARAEVAIVGGGYTGLSAALHMAEAGMEVVVLEAHEPGWGASGRNNGQVIPTLSRYDPDGMVALLGPEAGEKLAALVRDSAGFLFELVSKHGIACDAVQNGWLQPAHRAGRAALAKRRVEQWRQRGAPAEFLDRDAMQALFGSPHYHGGWINPTGGHVNPLGLARGLAAAAIKAGARVHGGTPATGIAATGSGWRIGTPTGAVVAKRVLLATAAYTDDLWPGLKQSIVPIRSYQMATRPLSDNLRRAILPGDHAMSDTRGDLHFCHFDRDGRLVTGGALLLPDDDGARIKAHIGQRMAWLFPELGVAEFDYVWHGQIAMTADRLPHLHELAPGLWSWLGCNGRGVALATAMGPVLAEAMQGVAHDRLAMTPTPLRPIQAHALLKELARGMLLLYRWRDARD